MFHLAVLPAEERLLERSQPARASRLGGVKGDQNVHAVWPWPCGGERRVHDVAVAERHVAGGGGDGNALPGAGCDGP